MEATWILEEALEYKGRPMTIEKEDQIRENQLTIPFVPKEVDIGASNLN